MTDDALQLGLKFDGDATGAVKAGQDAKNAVDGVVGATTKVAPASNEAAAGVEKLTAAHKAHAGAAGVSTESMHSMARGMRYAVSAAMTMEGQIQHTGHAIVGVMMGLQNPAMLAAMGVGVAIDLIAKHLEEIKKLWGDVGSASEDAAKTMVTATTDAVKKQKDLLDAATASTKQAQIQAFVATMPRDMQAQIQGILGEADATKALRDFEKEYGINQSNPMTFSHNSQMTQNSGNAVNSNVALTPGQQIAAMNDRAVAFGEEADRTRVIMAGFGDSWRKNAVAMNDLYALLQDNARAAKLKADADVKLAKAEIAATFEKKEPGASSLGSIMNTKWSSHDMTQGISPGFSGISDVMNGTEQMKKAIHDMYRGAEELANKTADQEQAMADAASTNALIAGGMGDQFKKLIGLGGDANDQAALDIAKKLATFADAIGDAGMAAEAAAMQEDASSKLNDIVETDYREALKKNREELEKAEQQLSGIAVSVIGGHGGQAIGGAIGGIAGSAASMALGDPTGQSGNAIGGAIGSALGALIDNLKPLQEAGKVMSDAFLDAVSMLTPIFAPLVEGARAFSLVFHEVTLNFLGPVSQALGQLVLSAVELFEAFAPLFGVLLDFQIPIMLIAKGADLLIGPLTQLAKAIKELIAGAFNTANQFVLLANSLGAHMQQFDINDLNAPSCFTPSTPVATPSGTRPIFDIGVGDGVWARDETTGVISICRVTKITRGRADEVIVIGVAGTSIGTTSAHRWWVTNRGEPSWIYAEALQVGDELLTMREEHVVIESIVRRPGPAKVCNLEVDGAHTFFVGDVPVLVHNGDKKQEELAAAKENAKQLKANTAALNAQQNNLPPGYKGVNLAAFNAAPTIIVIQPGQLQQALGRIGQMSRFNSIAAVISSRGAGDKKG